MAYTQWDVTQPPKEWNPAICSNMYGPRDRHTEWSKSDREGQTSYDNTYVWNLKKCFRWTYLQNRNRVTDVENNLMVTGVGKKGKDKLGDWNWHIHSTIYKIDNRASLVAQWLGVRLPVQGTRVRALAWEDSTCRRATEPVLCNKPRQWGPRTAANSSSCLPQLEKAHEQQQRPNTAKNKNKLINKLI